MGGKSSKTELKRSKSFSQFGRSSQRCLFQKSRTGLNQITKKLADYDGKVDTVIYDEIKRQLETIEQDLNNVSQIIKDKNKQKYEDVVKYLQETYQSFQDKIILAQEDFNKNEAIAEPIKQPVELKLVRVSSVEDLDVEVRKPRERIDEDVVRERSFDRPTSPKVKFGIQVMPVTYRISQEMLKHKTLPENEIPKAEFEQIRRSSETLLYDPKNNSRIKPNDVYNVHFPKQFNKVTQEQQNELYNYPESPKITTKTCSLPSSPNWYKAKEERKPEMLKKLYVDADAIQQIDEIAKHVNDLENKLRYFNGRKGDYNYVELNESFIRSLVVLDNVETHGDSVVKQERKILIHRIHELLKILDCLVKQNEEKLPIRACSDDFEYDYVEGQQEEQYNPQGKPVTATAL